jgi:hypothetical protein
MRRVLIIILFCTGGPFADAQTFTRENVVGTWVSTEVSFSKDSEKGHLENVTFEKARRGLVNSKFIFGRNGLFLIQLPGNAPSEFRELEVMNNKMWHIRTKEQKLFVGTLDEDLMMINVKISSGSYYFLIEDTPLILKMEKRSR